VYLIKFIFGIILIQISTVSLIIISPATPTTLESFIRLGVPMFFISLMVVFWFSSLVSNAKKDAIEKLKNEFYTEKEKIRASAQKAQDQLKDKVQKEKEEIHIKAQREIAKEARATSAKANFKVGASFAGVLGVGVLFVFAQMLTVGLLTFATAGGALGGYFYRGKRIANKEERNRLLGNIDAIDVKVIENKQDKPLS